MTFSIIGTGNIAWFLSKKIAAAGHQCKGVFGRNESAVNELADYLLAPLYGDLSKIEDGISDVCFLAVSDDAIAQIVPTLAFKQTILVHMAGSLPLNILESAAKDYGLLWPVYSINKQNMPAMRNIPCAWEASSDRAKRFLLEMGHAITDDLFEATEEQRLWLHICAVMSNNFINHLLAINEKLCNEHNLSLAHLQPLIKQTFDKAKNASALSAQTGPAIRSDNSTISKHMNLLGQYPELANIYDVLTKSIQTMHGVGEGDEPTE
jgi:predicted short-subunit dehydrogenase-like oxidoreductase (DUF2520 family)